MRRRSRTGLLRRRLRQDLREADFGRRRFRLRGGPARGRLEDAGRAFLEGFNEAVAGPGGDRLGEALAGVPGELRGFAAEGAGMGCALLDLVTLSRGRRLRALLDGPAADYPHLVHAGTGRAFAHLRLRPWHLLRAGDPLLRWLALDGYGFHQGFFHADRAVGAQTVESGFGGPRRAVRDQGLGRALWFHECADPEAVALRVAEFPAGRRADLWAGVGLAATYAGGCDPGDLAVLAVASGSHRAHLAQGSAFAAAAHVRSGLPLPAHCESGALAFTGAPATTAAGWTGGALATLGTGGGVAAIFGEAAGPADESAATDIAAYQAWRAGIRRRWFDHMTRLTPAAAPSRNPASAQAAESVAAPLSGHALADRPAVPAPLAGHALADRPAVPAPLAGHALADSPAISAPLAEHPEHPEHPAADQHPAAGPAHFRAYPRDAADTPGESAVPA